MDPAGHAAVVSIASGPPEDACGEAPPVCQRSRQIVAQVTAASDPVQKRRLQNSRNPERWRSEEDA